MRPRIWIDVDGVLAQFVPVYLQLIKEHTGREHSVCDVTDHNFRKCVASPDEDEHVWRNMVDARPGLVRGLAEVDGARAALESLRLIAQVGALTSPHLGPFWMHERALWLMDMGFSKREIIFASDKSHVAGDVFIDDHGDNCAAWQAQNPGGTALLFDAPWNRRTQATVQRVHDWHEAVSAVRRHLQGEP